MNHSHSSNYNETINTNTTPDYLLEEGFDKLSVEDYEGEVLYVTPQGSILTENLCGEYEDNNPLREDPAEWSFSSPLTEQVPGLDQPVGELRPEQIRWFYKSDSDKEWLPFTGYDSLRIEERFRQQRVRQPSGASQPSGCHSSSTTTTEPGPGCGVTTTVTPPSSDDSVYYDASSTALSDAEQDSRSQVKDHIVVRGGMYEVDIEKRKCASIFWPGEQCAIMRGAWFNDGSWQPLEDAKSEQVESVHLSLFANHLISEYISSNNSKLPKSVKHSESFSEFRIDWYSPLEVYLYSEAASSKLVRSFTQKLGYFQKSVGYRLCRGYKTLACLEDRPQDVTHLVFVIHGVGHKTDKDRIIRNTSALRDCTSWLQTKYFPSSQHRAEFFPVEWRASLKLDGGIVEAITPNKVQSIRQRLNATAMDIMYYTSPLYSQEIQKGLTCKLNHLYSTFTQRNPGFAARGGKVSVVAHSLGCVIVYDIVTGWSITHTLEQRKAQESSSLQNGADGTDGSQASASASAGSESPSPHSSQGSTPTPTPTHRPTKLLFELDSLFCLGSPLAVFLALRVQDPQAESCHKDLLPPSLCHRFFNIFHPSDPVAYRMEPLLVREYARVAPLQIQAYNAAIHTLYSDIPLELIVTDAAPAASQTATSRQGAADEGDSPKSPGGTPSRDRRWSLWSIVRGGWKAQDDAGTPHLDSPTQGLEHRLDYELRDSNLGGPYISAITSHSDYWRNYDVAYFVLTRLFPELEQLAITSTVPSAQSDSNQQSPQQQSPQQTTPRVASPPLLQQMLSQVQSQAQSVLQIQPPSLPLPSPTLLQRKGINETASR